MIPVLLTVFIDLVGFGVIIPLMPFYAERFGASPLTVTLLLASFSALQLFAAPLWGRLSDRIGRRPVLLISLLTSIAAYLWLGVADALWMLFAARALQGASAGNISVAQAYMADLTTAENRAKGMGMLGAAFGLGFIVGPAIGGWLAGSDPSLMSVERPAFVAAALSALALASALIWLPESLPAAQRAAPGAARRGRVASVTDAFRRPRLRALMVLFFTTIFAFAGMETTFALYASREFAWGPRQVGLMFGFIGIVLVIVQGGLIGRLTRRFGEQRILLAGTLTIGLGMAVLGLAWTPTIGILGSVFLAIGMGMAQPTSNALISREAASTEQGEIMGVNQSVGSLARFVGPAVAGLAFGSLGPRAPYLLGTAVMLLAAVLASRLARQDWARPPQAQPQAPAQPQAQAQAQAPAHPQAQAR
ncbi:MAG TPA: MFS transporter [Stellaceae bacterium]|nr:MFS transporter [Stellaceae bacterium]